MAQGKVTFELKEGFNRVEIAVQESDQHLVIESGQHTTNDPAEIAALDLNEGVKRVSASEAKKASASEGGK